MRDGQEIGVTPLVLQLDAHELEVHTSTFMLRRDGFAPYVWTQGPSTDAVTVRGVLPRLARPGGHVRPPPDNARPTGADSTIKTSR